MISRPIGERIPPGAVGTERHIFRQDFLLRLLRLLEALVATSTALLTVWDMVKGIDANLAIDDVKLIEKRKEPIA